VDGTTIYDLHGRLVRDAFGRRLSDQDAFLVIVLFHSYRIILSAPILTDRPGIVEVAAGTQRGVSEALAKRRHGAEKGLGLAGELLVEDKPRRRLRSFPRGVLSRPAAAAAELHIRVPERE
jgi:hypothetical protein